MTTTNRIRTELGLKVIQYQTAAARLRVQAEAERAMITALPTSKEQFEALLAASAKVAASNTMTTIAAELSAVLASTIEPSEKDKRSASAERWGARGYVVGRALAMVFVGASALLACMVIVWLAKQILGLS